MKTLSFLLALAATTIGAADLQYTLAPEPAQRCVRVTMEIPDAGAKELVRIPRWCPGFYFLMRYDEKVFDFAATTLDGHALEAVAKPIGGWEIQNPARTPIRVRYRVRGDDPGLGFFAVNVDPSKAFVNGAATFMYSPSRLTTPISLSISLPVKWDIATAMTEKDGHYVASGYDELIDHPIQMGAFQRRKFEVEGVPFEAIFVAPNEAPRCNVDREAENLRVVAAPALKLFGGAAFKKYLFIIHLAVGNFGGGLEHRSSCVIATSNSRELGIEDLAAHEYFHAWNVKQIRPQVLGPFDYEREVRTANLWFAEGVTDYYAKLTTYRSGLRDARWLLGELQAAASELASSRNRHSVTLSDCSRRAWENGGFGVGDLSYYTKGLLVGWILDCEIRRRTSGLKSLDDVMRRMFARYRLPKAGYPEGGILEALQQETGDDWTDLYRVLVNSTDELPYELVGSIGLAVSPNGRVGFASNPSSEASKLLQGWLEIGHNAERD